jgi:uncharacterized phage infection (PIP) family protein YhgE
MPDPPPKKTKQTTLTGIHSTMTPRNTPLEPTLTQSGSSQGAAATGDLDRTWPRRGVNPATQPEENYEIQDSTSGLSFLKKKKLLAPSGLSPALDDLASALFHIGDLPGTPLQTLNGIRSVAFLLKDANITSSSTNISTTIHELVKPSLEKLAENMESRLLEVSEGLRSAMDSLLAKAQATMDDIRNLASQINDSAENLNKVSSLSYCDTLMSNTSAQSARVDPRLRAKEGIQA